MAKKNKGARQQIMWRNPETGTTKISEKNVRTTTDKLTRRMYDPKTRKHEEFREEKVKS